MSEADFRFLHGVVLANYRGIGGEPIKIGLFQRFNFMIGPNNAGKSCVLRFISQHLKPLVIENPRHYSSPKVTLDPLDTHSFGINGVARMGVAFSNEKPFEKMLMAVKDSHWSRQINELIQKLSICLSPNGLLWLERKGDDQKLLSFFEGDFTYLELFALAEQSVWQMLWQILTGHSNGGIQIWIEQVQAEIIRSLDLTLPAVSLIPAIREISPTGQEFTDWDGKGLIDELARLQNPGVHERNKLEKFERINAFLRTVTESHQAKIEIPHGREHVLVHMDGKVLPLESLGTGIHEVVMLAAFCTLMENQIVCIEEPEIHLHPLLQRRLMQYLHDETTNQYFIATHSAAFIDTPDSAVFHVTNHEGKTQINLALSPNSHFDICRDLGYKASDILQANAIVWVEGPSDRIYLRHWISALAPELREGIDYSIMFYGGRLLSHLSADDSMELSSDIDALIACRQLNRNLAVLIDSDKDKEEKPINATKARIVDELATDGIAWVTAGREIENYVSVDLMTEALRESYPNRFGERYKKGCYDHVLPFRDGEKKIVNEVDKVKVAKAICGKDADLDVLDLRVRITELVAFIRKANR